LNRSVGKGMAVTKKGVKKMIAQIGLTPKESKKLIAKTIYSMDFF
jgi:hypothetical protein